jgi:hypothetical protein
MPRATIVVCVDESGEAASVEAWFKRWGDKLSHRSGNHGCGCCVDVWEIEGPAEAIAELPPATYAGDEWTMEAK